MDQEAVKLQVLDVVIENLGLGAEDEEVLLEARFTEDLGADSLDAVEIVMEVEARLGVTVPDEDMGNLETVGDLVRYVEGQLSGEDDSPWEG